MCRPALSPVACRARQVNDLEAEKVKLNSEAFRLELELSKVLRENEELFKTRLGAGAGVKTGASAHLVHSLKRRIKELEGTVTKKEDELKKVRSDTRVTRLAEMEVEKDAYLYEVRRLQKELAHLERRDDVQARMARQRMLKERARHIRGFRKDRRA